MEASVSSRCVEVVEKRANCFAVSSVYEAWSASSSRWTSKEAVDQSIARQMLRRRSVCCDGPSEHQESAAVVATDSVEGTVIEQSSSKAGDGCARQGEKGVEYSSRC